MVSYFKCNVLDHCRVGNMLDSHVSIRLFKCAGNAVIVNSNRLTYNNLILDKLCPDVDNKIIKIIDNCDKSTIIS